MATALERPSVVEAVERSADPVTARVALARLTELYPELAEELAHSRTLVDALVAVAVTSRSLLAGMLVDPGMIDALRDQGQLAIRAPTRLTSAAGPRRACRTSDAAAASPPLGAANWYESRPATFWGSPTSRPSVARLISLPEAALEIATELARPGTPFAVIGMGKLGGAELNYASDVDVLFVHDGDANAAGQGAREVLS